MWQPFIILGSVFGILTLSTAHALVPLSLTTRFAHNGGVSDHRNDGEGSFSLSRFDFVFGLRAFNEDDYKAGFQVALPLRTLQMDRGSSERIGSEFGGYQVSYNQTLFDHFGLDLSYSDHSSSRLGLFENNKSLETMASLKAMGFVNSAFLLRAAAGPGLRLSSDYGPMYVARANAEIVWQNDFAGKWLLGATAFFRQRTASAGEPRANLFTVQPQLAWEIVRDLWVSAQYTKSLARPVGFESAMGDAGLSGLYGDSFSVGISTASL